VSRPKLSGRFLNRRILNRRILTRRVLPALAVVLVVGFTPTVWLWLASAAHMSGSSAPVVIVFGAQLTDDGTQPKPFLKGRLDAAVSAVRSGRPKVVLVSGDEHGTSGNEVAATTRYLQDAGIPARHIVPDGAGLDTYDTCRRAHDVIGVRKALLASQEFHLHRAVTLCRSLGIDADGVAAACTAPDAVGRILMAVVVPGFIVPGSCALGRVPGRRR
jgi:vancomycin permeability regulator SanA